MRRVLLLCRGDSQHLVRTADKAISLSKKGFWIVDLLILRFSQICFTSPQNRCPLVEGLYVISRPWRELTIKKRKKPKDIDVNIYWWYCIIQYVGFVQLTSKVWPGYFIHLRFLGYLGLLIYYRRMSNIFHIIWKHIILKGWCMLLLVPIVIYEALGFDLAQGRMKGSSNETRTHSCSFASLAY